MRFLPTALVFVIFGAGSSLGCGGNISSDALDAGDIDASLIDGGTPDAPTILADAEVTSAPQFPELWYSVDDRLVHIELAASDGSVVAFTESTMAGLALGQNSLTMLDDGSLVGARLSADQTTRFYHIPNPPRDGATVTPIDLGLMPNGIMLEALYTDCDGRLYGMDTGEDNTNAVGNRLLRFTADYLAGDFQFVIVSDLSTADVADIDDMGPGITDNLITDNPGFAIDTGTVYDFAYDTGSGSLAGTGGTFGIHALGGPLFDDARSRLYLFSAAGELFEMSVDTFQLSESLGAGPTDVEGRPGWSGLAGPLTDCNSGFVVD